MIAFEEYAIQASQATKALCDIAKLQAGDLLVVGCSTSEVLGHPIGTQSSLAAAQMILQGITQILAPKQIWLAAQCCEHLNRALIIPQAAAQAYHLDIVNVVPQAKAGGSFATAAYQHFEHPVAVESICAAAKAGMDIGDTLIGMHIQSVVVPVRLSCQYIGKARVICARHRPKFVGGIRAQYDESLL